MTELKKFGPKVLLALGGWNDSAGSKYSRLVNSPFARSKFIKHVVSFLKQNNFDGLDLDWEYPKCWQVSCMKRFSECFDTEICMFFFNCNNRLIVQKALVAIKKDSQIY